MAGSAFAPLIDGSCNRHTSLPVLTHHTGCSLTQERASERRHHRPEGRPQTSNIRAPFRPREGRLAAVSSAPRRHGRPGSGRRSSARRLVAVTLRDEAPRGPLSLPRGAVLERRSREAAPRLAARGRRLREE
mmetsp:Transcript_1158/g.3469  ORF Transcript_1158/g.3469 Transcript_1158/m.3469 type:complete len:132 (+) Transcript_1158:619-1014(+)